MIAILSHNYLEITTEEVIDWLDYYKAKWIRINGDDLLNTGTIQLNSKNNLSLSLKLNGIYVDMKNINIIWNRRWIYHDFYEQHKHSFSFDVLKHKLTKHLADEFTKATSAFFQFLSTIDTKWVSHHKYQRIDKINVLNKAIKLGLEIPDTLITTSKAEVRTFVQQHSLTITKSIGESSSFPLQDNTSYVHYTQEVNAEVLENMPNSFFPSLFQEGVDKVFEIRSFYFKGKFYSMAIFSQSNHQTKIDFRVYDSEVPNRNIPFNLPENIEIKLKALMDELNLDTGSIDLIKDKNGRYVFLEVNSRGQFGMTSHPCNYFLERKVAQHLIENN